MKTQVVMTAPLCTFLCLVVYVASHGSEAAEPATSARRPPGLSPPSIASAESTNPTELLMREGNGARPLFNGIDLDGWQVRDGKVESWIASAQTISCVAPNGGWLTTTANYSDFLLHVEYRLSPGGNSGIALRCPEAGNLALSGLEVQLLDDTAEKYRNLNPEQYTGAIYYQVAPIKQGVSRPAGQWNTCDILCLGPRIQIAINSEVVNDVQLDAAVNGKVDRPARLTERPPTGHIGLQSHTSRIDFRNIRLKDLSQSTSSGVRYVDLREGNGAVVPANAHVTVHYVGQLTSGLKFDSSRDRGKPVTVRLGDVIAGWRDGIPGMKVGGRRKLIIPPELAYGAQGVRNVIPPQATLIFDIELQGFQE